MQYKVPEDKIILAIDGLSINDAILILRKCPNIKWIKIGLEIFTREGPSVIKVMKGLGKKIFLDLKFYDIPNTMSSACYEVSKLGVDMISVHASAGLKALIASKESIVKGSEEINLRPPSIIGVTILTSFNSEDLQIIFNKDISIKECVNNLANLSFEAGLDGCVCSPWEVENLRSIYTNNFQLITPGIRIEGDDNNDQNRVMNPNEAISRGASKIVVGRSITKSINPLKTFEEICNSISS